MEVQGRLTITGNVGERAALQRRADSKDSWPGLWDISSAGHIFAGDSSLVSARRELHEELGIVLPKDAFELIFVFLQECIINDGKYINNEYNDVYLVTTLDPIPLEAFTLQETEVSAVKYISYEDYRSLLAEEHPDYVPMIFFHANDIIFLNAIFVGIVVDWPIRWRQEGMGLLVNAARVVDEIFYLQEFELWKGTLTENKKSDATGFFTVIKRHSEFDLDTSIPNHTVDGRDHSIGVHDLFSIPYSKEYNSLITRAADLLHKAGDLACSPSKAAAFLSNDYYDSDIAWMELDSKLDVTIGPYETYEDALFGYKVTFTYSIWLFYSALMTSDIAKTGDIYEIVGSNVPDRSGKICKRVQLLASGYQSWFPQAKAWGSHATFEAFIRVRDDEATAQLKLFGNNLQVLEQNLPMDNAYKSIDVNAAPIRVIQLIYNAGDVKGPQTVAFNILNDERIVKERGTSMVMLKNVSEAKFKHILQPIADVCIAKEQKELVDFESFFTHTICMNAAMDLLPKSLLKSMYVSFLAGCFRSIRFGLEEAHGKGQAVRFNWLFEKEAFILHPDETFSVDFAKVPVDIAPTFTFAKDIME
ncbi:hypothetical protein GH714_025728 [Hevea brasiliensis]|uniref:Nudix hydrolase domain-containing protein n=1 Tax=Hevea brasiliensis TaxID=3981 RepID=A0A6A6LMR9_HEVBR|nr:hypothetical protein GH714_025728 [Hevea brasiliensis]